jgi:hypothetical protein
MQAAARGDGGCATDSDAADAPCFRFLNFMLPYQDLQCRRRDADKVCQEFTTADERRKKVEQGTESIVSTVKRLIALNRTLLVSAYHAHVAHFFLSVLIPIAKYTRCCMRPAAHARELTQPLSMHVGCTSIQQSCAVLV